VALVQEELLEGTFGAAEPEHFTWQTETPYVSDRERELVRRAFEPLGANVLDLGCGEGATFLHLGREAHATGVDLFEEKLAFARRRLPSCTFVVGSAYELPFADGSFDHLLIRDVIHHVAEPARLVNECARVLAPGGRIDILEPCRNNPLIFLHALTNPAERGELRSTPSYLAGLFARRFFLDQVERLQPMPIHRLVFHPQMGSPSLAKRPAVARAVRAFESLAETLLPELVWAYIHVRATRRG
jgi:SAM-dependent methyltransferase